MWKLGEFRFSPLRNASEDDVHHGDDEPHGAELSPAAFGARRLSTTTDTSKPNATAGSRDYFRNMIGTSSLVTPAASNKVDRLETTNPLYNGPPQFAADNLNAVSVGAQSALLYRRLDTTNVLYEPPPMYASTSSGSARSDSDAGDDDSDAAMHRQTTSSAPAVAWQPVMAVSQNDSSLKPVPAWLTRAKSAAATATSAASKWSVADAEHGVDE